MAIKYKRLKRTVQSNSKVSSQLNTKVLTLENIKFLINQGFTVKKNNERKVENI